MNNLSKEIKKYRYKRGLTQSQFGDLFDPAVDKSTVSDWERGVTKPSPANHKRILAVISKSQEPEVLKRKKGKPTKIKWQGMEYAMIHPDQYRR